MAVDREHGTDSSMFFSVAGKHMLSPHLESKGRSKSIILEEDSLWTPIVIFVRRIPKHSSVL